MNRLNKTESAIVKSCLIIILASKKISFSELICVQHQVLEFYIRAASWQNQQNDLCGQRRLVQPVHPPSLIRVFAVHMKKAWIKRSAKTLIRLPSLICVFAARTYHFVGFVMWRLKFSLFKCWPQTDLLNVLLIGKIWSHMYLYEKRLVSKFLFRNCWRLRESLHLANYMYINIYEYHSSKKKTKKHRAANCIRCWRIFKKHLSYLIIRTKQPMLRIFVYSIEYSCTTKCVNPRSTLC